MVNSFKTANPNPDPLTALWYGLILLWLPIITYTYHNFNTLIILSFRTNRSGQTVQTKIRLSIQVVSEVIFFSSNF